MKGLERLTVIRNISLKKGSEWVHKDIFRLLNKKDIWFIGYTNVLRSENKVPNFLNTLEEEQLNKWIDDVITERYKPNLIKKTTFVTREKPLHTNKPYSFFDKIVIEVIKIIIKSIFESLISESNFGRLKNTNEHSALQYVEKEFQNCNLIIEGKICNYVSTIDNSILFNFVNKKIDDIRFMNLIKKVLNAEAEMLTSKIMPPNQVIESSLKYALFDIYICQFDEWVNKFKSHYLKNDYKTILQNDTFLLDTSFKNLTYSQKHYNLARKHCKDLHKENEKPLFLKNSGTTIKYVRYIQDWIIGIETNTNLAIQVKKETENFLLNNLKLSAVNTKLVSLTNGNISFLNYEIYLPRIKTMGQIISRESLEKNRLRFEAPIKKLLEELENNGIIKSIPKGYRSISKNNLSTCEDYTIVFYFNSIWLALCKYYSGTTNPHRLQYIHNLLQISCAMTLAHKHRSSCSEIFKKKGKGLTIYSPNTKRKISFTDKSGLYFKTRRWETMTYMLNPFKAIQNRIKTPRIDL